MKRYIYLFMMITTASLYAGDGAGHGIDWFLLGGSIFNFFLLIGLIIFFARKKIKEALIQRKEEMSEQINAFKKAKEEAEAQLEIYKEKMAKLDVEIAEIKMNYETISNEKIEALKQKNTSDIQKLKENYERELTTRMQLVRQDLKQELMDNAIALSEKMLVEQFEKDSKSELELIKKFSIKP